MVTHAIATDVASGWVAVQRGNKKKDRTEDFCHLNGCDRCRNSFPLHESEYVREKRQVVLNIGPPYYVAAFARWSQVGVAVYDLHEAVKRPRADSGQSGKNQTFNLPLHKNCG
jgi:hypothetical protein